MIDHSLHVQDYVNGFCHQLQKSGINNDQAPRADSGTGAVNGTYCLQITDNKVKYMRL